MLRKRLFKIVYARELKLGGNDLCGLIFYFGHICTLEIGVIHFLGTFFVRKFQNNALCYNMLNRLHVLYIYVSTNCQEEFVLFIEYIYYFV